MERRELKIYLELCEVANVKASFEGAREFKEVIIKWYFEKCEKHNITPNLEELKVACEKMILQGHKVV